MPTNKSAFFRYLLIDRCLTRRKSIYYSAEEILEYIESNIDERISLRTLQGDIKEMKESNVLGFYAPIKYDKSHDGYYYTDQEYSIGRFVKLDNEDYTALEFALNILDVYKNVPALAHFKHTVDKLSSQIQIKKIINHESFERTIFPEVAPHVEGLKYMQDIAFAIKNRITLSIEYLKFGNAHNIKHTFHPYCLKEYNERWYTIGWGEKSKGIMHLALDRIKHIESNPNKNYKDIDFDAVTYFKHYFGVTVNPEAEPERIVISFISNKGQYLKTRHIHSSQKLIMENKDDVVFEFYLIPNYEFINFLLGCASEFKIIQPESLKKIVNDRFSLALTVNK